MNFSGSANDLDDAKHLKFTILRPSTALQSRFLFEVKIGIRS